MEDQDPKTASLTEEQKEAIKKEKKKAKEDAKAAKIAKAKNKVIGGEKKEEKKEEKAKPEEKKKPAKVEEPAFVNNTTPGEKKDMSQPMRAGYEPRAVEAAWYDWWTKKGFFHADNQSERTPFVIVIPPPNVTGSLHLGHALTNSVEDAITRWHRASGRNALWVPGTDHAGIATQAVVEKKLMRENQQTRHDLGREKFVEKVWDWKKVYGGRIVNQLKRLGSSLDWEREVFTMDEKLSRAVTEAFVQMFDKELIYRETRLVNWCTKLNTAISDIEVEYVELEGPTKMSVPGYEKVIEFGVLHEFAYKVDGEDSELVVATTRIETMLADTAVAVHPDDVRYNGKGDKKNLIGKMLIHPFHPDRKIPIVADGTLVDMSFGTGAVKVTPAHDPNDFACGKRNKLEFINMLNDDGTINANGGQFKGMRRFDARYAVIDELKKLGLYRGSKPNKMSIGTCSRSRDIIEPVIKPQWYVNCQNMAKKACDVVRSGELEIIPSNHKAKWFSWLEDIRDWCISRQLWWGHRCPAYLVCVDGEAKADEAKNWVVGRNEAEARANALKKFPEVNPDKLTLKQDPDVLDTWFSSSLFPFSVFGWPEKTPDLAKFYPTSLLETGSDILFFWVARMVMMGQELTGQLPFKQVFLHAMVRDAHGRKMSKSLGNVIDPISIFEGISLESLHKTLEEGNLDPKEVQKAKEGQKQDYPNGIPECGTDATRFALCAYTSQGRNINLDIARVAAYRNFCNKLWNATKFALMNLGTDFKPAAKQGNEAPVSAWEKWILARLNDAIKLTNSGFQEYDFAQATTAVYNFWLYELCDVYLESMKPTMQKTNVDDADVAKRQASMRETLYTCLDNGLRLLQPFMPFISEELYQRLPRRSSESFESVCIAPFPQEVKEWIDEEGDKGVKMVQDINRTIRSLRTSFNLTKEKPAVIVSFKDAQLMSSLETYREAMAFLTQSSSIDFALNAQHPEGSAVDIVNESCQVYMVIKGLVDIKVEMEKLEKKKAKSQSEHDRLFKTTQGVQYAKVPESIKSENTKKLEGFKEEVAMAEKMIENYKKFI